MKKIIKIALVLALALVLFVFSTEAALADTSTSGSEVNGVITSIDKTVTPPTVTVTPKEGSAIVLKVDASTLISKIALGNITINDLAVNDQVTATYSQDTNIAGKITVIQPTGKRHSFEGTVKSKSGTTLVVTTNKADETFQVSSATQYKVPGVKNATLDNFNVGNKVSVSIVEVTTGSTTVQMAQRLTFIPAKQIKVSHQGTITAYTANASITIQDKKGNSTTFVINSDTKINFKKGVTAITVGDQATVLTQRDPSESQFTAKTINVSAAKVVKGNQNGKSSEGTNGSQKAGQGKTTAQGKNNGKNNKNK